MTAYVLIQTERDRGGIAETLQTIPGIVVAQDVVGAFDAIALAQAPSARHLQEGIVEEIKKVPGVIHALSAPLIGPLAEVRTAEPSRSEVAA